MNIRNSIALAALLCVPLSHPQLTRAADDPPPTITRVVESWAFQVRTPDEGEGLPQITCVMAPSCSLVSHHAVLELNSWTVPSYNEGGIQLQVWHGDCACHNVTHPNYGKLQHSGETVTFDLAMEIQNGQLLFEVINGESTSWGQFGGTGTMKLSVQTALEDLDDYDPNFTIANTAVSRGAQNLEVMQFRGYKKFSGSDLVEETQVPVDKHNFLQVVK